MSENIEQVGIEVDVTVKTDKFTTSMKSIEAMLQKVDDQLAVLKSIDLKLNVDSSALTALDNRITSIENSLKNVNLSSIKLNVDTGSLNQIEYNLKAIANTSQVVSKTVTQSMSDAMNQNVKDVKSSTEQIVTIQKQAAQEVENAVKGKGSTKFNTDVMLADISKFNSMAKEAMKKGLEEQATLYFLEAKTIEDRLKQTFANRLFLHKQANAVELEEVRLGINKMIQARKDATKDAVATIQEEVKSITAAKKSSEADMAESYKKTLQLQNVALKNNLQTEADLYANRAIEIKQSLENSSRDTIAQLSQLKRVLAEAFRTSQFTDVPLIRTDVLEQIKKLNVLIEQEQHRSFETLKADREDAHKKEIDALNRQGKEKLEVIKKNELDFISALSQSSKQNRVSGSTIGYFMTDKMTESVKNSPIKSMDFNAELEATLKSINQIQNISAAQHSDQLAQFNNYIRLRNAAARKGDDELFAVHQQNADRIKNNHSAAIANVIKQIDSEIQRLKELQAVASNNVIVNQINKEIEALQRRQIVAARQQVTLNNAGLRAGTDVEIQNMGGQVNSVNGLTNAMNNLQRALMLVGVTLSGRQVMEYADQWTHFTNAIRITNGETANAAVMQAKLYSLAQDARAPIESVTTLYLRMSRASESLNLSQTQTVAMINTVTKALAIMGTSPSQVRGGLLQLEQALGGVVVRGQEFKSILDSMPVVMSTVVKHYDEASKAIDLENAAMRGASETELQTIKNRKETIKSIADLRNQMYEGKITSEAFARAILLGQKEIDFAFEKSHKTFAQAFTELDNGFTRIVGRMNEGTEASNKFFNMMQSLSNNLDSVGAVLAGLAATMLLLAIRSERAAAAMILLGKSPVGLGLGVVAGLAAKDMLEPSESQKTAEKYVKVEEQLNKAKQLGNESEVARLTNELSELSSKMLATQTAQYDREIEKLRTKLALFEQSTSGKSTKDVIKINEQGVPTVTSIPITVPKISEAEASKKFLDGKSKEDVLKEIESFANLKKSTEMETEAKLQEARIASAQSQLTNQKDLAKKIMEETSSLALAKTNALTEADKKQEEISKKYTDLVLKNIEKITAKNQILKQQFESIPNAEDKIKRYEQLFKPESEQARATAVIAAEREIENAKKDSAARELENLRKGAEAKISTINDTIERVQEELRKNEKTLEIKVKVSPQVQKFSPLFEKYGEQYGVSPALLASLAHQETGGTGKTNLVSPAGAAGLMQFMPPTAKQFGVTDRFDPEQSIEGAAKYMAYLLKKFSNDTEKAVAAYNAGEGAIGRRVSKLGSDWKSTLAPETAKYIPEVMGRIGGETQVKQSELISKKEEIINELLRKRQEYQDALAKGDVDKLRSLDSQLDSLTRQNNTVNKMIANEAELAEKRVKANKEWGAEQDKIFKAAYENEKRYEQLRTRRTDKVDFAKTIQEQGISGISTVDAEILKSIESEKSLAQKYAEFVKQAEELKKLRELSPDDVARTSIQNELDTVTKSILDTESSITAEKRKQVDASNAIEQAQKAYNQAAESLDKKLIEARGRSFFGALFGGKGEVQIASEKQARAEGVMTEGGRIIDEKRFEKIKLNEQELSSLEFQERQIAKTFELVTNTFSSFADKIIKEGKSVSDALGETARDMFSSMASDMMKDGMKNIMSDNPEIANAGKWQLATSTAFTIGSMLYSSKGKDNTMPATLATGTVLGMPNSVSQSVDNVVKTLNDIHYKEYPELRNMGKNFKELTSSIDDFIAAVAKSTGNFSNMIDIPAAKVNLAGDKMINAAAGMVMGAVMGALTGGLFGAIAGGLMGGMMGFAGTQATVTRIGEGIMLNATTLVMDATEQAMVTGNTFAKDKIEIKGILGIKTEIVEQFGELSDTFSTSFNKVVQATAKTIWGIGKDLNLESILGERLTTIRTPRVKWDTMDANKSGTTGQFLKDQVNAYLDRIAESVFGNLLGRFQKLGEGMLETVARINASVGVAIGGLERLGVSVKATFKDSPMGAIEFSNAMAELWDSTGNAKDGVKNLATALNNFYDVTTSAGDKLTDSFTTITSTIAQFNAKNPQAALNVTASNIKGSDLLKMNEVATKNLAEASLNLGAVSKFAEPIKTFENPASASAESVRDALGSFASSHPGDWGRALGTTKFNEATWDTVNKGAYGEAQFRTWAKTIPVYQQVVDLLDQLRELQTNAEAELVAGGTTMRTTKELDAKMKPLQEIVNDQAEAQAMILATTQAYQAILENRNTVIAAEVNILKTNSTIEQQRQYQIKKDFGTYNAETGRYDFAAYNVTQDIRKSTDYGLTPQTLAQYDEFVKNADKYVEFIGQEGVDYVKNVEDVIRKSLTAQKAYFEKKKSETTDVKEIATLDANISALNDSLKSLDEEGIAVTTMGVKLFESAMTGSAEKAQILAKQALAVSSLLTDGRLTTDAEKRILKHNADIANIGMVQSDAEIARKKELFAATEQSMFLQDREAAILKRRLTLADATHKASIQYEQDVKAINDKWLAADPKKAKELIDLLASGLNALKLTEAKNALNNFRQSVAEWVIGLRTTQLGSTKTQLDIAAAKFDYRMALLSTTSGANVPYSTAGIQNKDVKTAIETYIAQLTEANKNKTFEEIKTSMLGTVTGDADALITAIRNFYGSSKQGIDLIEAVIAKVSSLPDAVDAQTQMVDLLQQIKDGIYRIPNYLSDTQKSVIQTALDSIAKIQQDTNLNSIIKASSIDTIAKIIIELDATAKTKFNDDIKEAVYGSAQARLLQIDAVLKSAQVTDLQKFSFIKAQGFDVANGLAIISAKLSAPNDSDIDTEMKSYNDAVKSRLDKITVLFSDDSLTNAKDAGDAINEALKVIRTSYKFTFSVDGISDAITEADKAAAAMEKARLEAEKATKKHLLSLQEANKGVVDSLKSANTQLVDSTKTAIDSQKELLNAINAVNTAKSTPVVTPVVPTPAVTPVVPNSPLTGLSTGNYVPSANDVTVSTKPAINESQQMQELFDKSIDRYYEGVQSGNIRPSDTFYQNSLTNNLAKDIIAVETPAVVKDPEIQKIIDTATAAASQKDRGGNPTWTAQNAQNVLDNYKVWYPNYFANGGAFTNGIVSEPTFFNMGLMGEAGSEAIMPLTNVNGKLGVYAANDGNTNRDEEIAELRAQNANLQKIVNLLVAQNQVHQAGYSAIIEENQQQTDSLRSIRQTNKEVAYG